jgi:S-adenosylmethionine hydrolase
MKIEQIPKGEQELINKLSLLIEQSKEQIAVQANNTLTLLFWHIGKNIKEYVLNNKRADYGKQIVSTVSTQLVIKHGISFEARNLRRMIQFFELYPNLEIAVPLARQL